MNSNRNSSRGRQEGKKSTPLSRKSTSSSKKSTPLSRNTPKKTFTKIKEAPKSDESSGIRLNKYIANSGVCSRREADTYIEHGSVEVNGNLVTEMGYKVQPNDIVRFDGTSITPEQKKYILLNKPKNILSTVDDTKGRRTVMNVIKGVCKEAIYPVGKLDRMTTGLLLFTNDGDMAKRLIHPKNGVSRLYEVHTREKVKSPHLDEIRQGVMIGDGMMRADEVAYVGDGTDPHKIGIRISSSRNKVVTKMFEHFGYTITKMDRVMYAGLSKKNLSRGDFRELTQTEVNFLKMIR